MFPPCLYCRMFNLILLTWKDIKDSSDSNLFKSDSPQASLFQMDETAQEFWHRGLCDLLTMDHRFHPAVCVCVGPCEWMHIMFLFPLPKPQFLLILLQDNIRIMWKGHSCFLWLRRSFVKFVEITLVMPSGLSWAWALGLRSNSFLN